MECDYLDWKRIQICGRLNKSDLNNKRVGAMGFKWDPWYLLDKTIGFLRSLPISCAERVLRLTANARKTQANLLR